MPQDIVKNQNTQMAPNLIHERLPPDMSVAKGIDDLGKSISNMMGVAMAGNAKDTLAAGERQREQDAIKATDNYKNTLYQAASQQDSQTFGRFYAEAQKYRTAALQGIMSDSAAQIRIANLEKNLAYTHPHLSGELRAAGAAISGNASQVAKLITDDPAIKAVEGIIKDAMAKGMTPAEYMGYNRQEALYELKQKEVKLATDTRAYNSQQYTAAMSSMWDTENYTRGLDFMNSLNETLRASGGMMPGVEIAKQITQFKTSMMEQRIREIDEVTITQPDVDRAALVKEAENRLKWLDDMASLATQGGYNTFEHTKALLDYRKKALEYSQETEFNDLLRRANVPPMIAWAFKDNPAGMVQAFIQLKPVVDAINIMGEGMTPELEKAMHTNNPLGYFGARLLLGDKTGLLLHAFTGSTALLSGQDPSVGAGINVPPVDSLMATACIKNFNQCPDKAVGALQIAQAPIITTVKIATSDNEELKAQLRQNPAALEKLRDKTITELSEVLRDETGNIRLAGGTLDKPFQYGPNPQISSDSNRALDDANKIMRAYQTIDPMGYKSLLDLIFQMTTPPKQPDQQP